MNLDERLIKFDSECFGIPERLLLEHAGGRSLFVAGAGVSFGSNLPDFKTLTRQVYKKLDPSLFAWIKEFEERSDPKAEPDYSKLNVKEEVEARRYIAENYDVGLGMLERRMDSFSQSGSKVRQVVGQILLDGNLKSNSVHKSLLRLSDRGVAIAIVTTNFDRLFQKAAGNLKIKLKSYSLGGIPRPDRRESFGGIFHIHGLLDSDVSKPSDLVLTEQDFGENYFRRRIAPDFLYDALRLFDLIFVGYSLNDPPMQYLMNAVAADANRFPDLGKRYILLGTEQIDKHEKEDWSARGFIPIYYNSKNNHSQLGYTLEKWAKYSPHQGKSATLEQTIRRIMRIPRSHAPDYERDLFDHIYRRSSAVERTRISQLLQMGAVDWLNAMNAIEREEYS